MEALLSNIHNQFQDQHNRETAYGVITDSIHVLSPPLSYSLLRTHQLPSLCHLMSLLLDSVFARSSSHITTVMVSGHSVTPSSMTCLGSSLPRQWQLFSLPKSVGKYNISRRFFSYAHSPHTNMCRRQKVSILSRLSTTFRGTIIGWLE